MLLPRFDPPGFLDDLNDAQRQAWSDSISQDLDGELAHAAGNHFYNPVKTDTAPDVQTAEISWTAFPRKVSVNATSDPDRWQTADGSRDVQDEYCEWSVTRDPATMKIRRVTFTAEGPEYWQFLASQNPQKVLALYRQFVNPQVQMSDLFQPAGAYQARNKWNTDTTHGAMHLVQVNNTLGAELNIAVRASVIRKDKHGNILTGEQDLITCDPYGDPDRNSDPHIGGEINKLARAKADITIANPVALYIKDLDTAGWAAPDGSDPKQYWTIVRGDAAHGLRAVYEVPAAKGFTVGDLTINGAPIQFGAQIADFITIKIVGQICRIGQNTNPPLDCPNMGSVAAPLPAVAAARHPAARRRR